MPNLTYPGTGFGVVIETFTGFLKDNGFTAMASVFDKAKYANKAVGTVLEEEFREHPVEVLATVAAGLFGVALLGPETLVGAAAVESIELGIGAAARWAA